MNKTIVAAVTAAAVLAGFSTSAMAAREAGDWIFRVGMTNVDPKQGNGEVDTDGLVPEVDGAPIDVADDTQVSFTGTYMFTPNLGLELLASLPFEHDISVGGVQVGSTKHLPPTLNLQWHFNPAGEFHPYVGAGVNYTIFFDEDWDFTAIDLLAGTDLNDLDYELKESFGYDLQAGVDFEISETLLLNFDVRWIKIESDLEAKGVGKIAEVKIDPLTVGVSLGWKF